MNTLVSLPQTSVEGNNTYFIKIKHSTKNRKGTISVCFTLNLLIYLQTSYTWNVLGRILSQILLTSDLRALHVSFP
jgi:hypothetical protein